MATACIGGAGGARSARWVEFRKRALTPAFARLRRRGIYATVRDLGCCDACAISRHFEHHDRFVYYHMEDVSCFAAACRCGSAPDLYLGFHLPRTEDVRFVVATLRRYAHVEWEGDVSVKIRVWPRVSPRERWSQVRSGVLRRAVGVYWKERTAHLYAEGGVGRARDRAAFERDCAELLPRR